MTSEGLGEMFEGDSADTGVRKYPLVSMGGRAEGFACADPGARTPIGASRIFFSSLKTSLSLSLKTKESGKDKRSKGRKLAIKSQ